MTFKYDNVYITDTITTAGVYEAKGPLAKYFDKTYTDFYIGTNSWEKAEKQMLTDSVNLLLNKINKKNLDIDLFISGDLLNQMLPSCPS